MTKQTIEVDVPYGWKAVAFRRPTTGEAFIADSGTLIDCSESKEHRVLGPRIILEREWQAPNWIKPGTWLAMEPNGDWWMHSKEPAIIDNEWASDGELVLLDYDIDKFTDFTFPPCTDWRASKRQIGAQA